MKGSKLQLFNLNNIPKFRWIPISIQGATAKISFGPLNITFGGLYHVSPPIPGKGAARTEPDGSKWMS